MRADILQNIAELGLRIRHHLPEAPSPVFA
jgi:hypothetical protein